MAKNYSAAINVNIIRALFSPAKAGQPKAIYIFLS